ncbi:hypothetical protein [Mycobacterium asiaticum]|uniref:PE domain-containing protein n=1 Tax=Mycobacterium asiaticum TaxID=1790 RepID=A0A1A3C812_MYCAS|nr:hypothetical protein [Mycobacterium asiaticum]OBI82497.1 hypothetical protein A9X01_22145 [Mycobacterium asiaticum]
MTTQLELELQALGRLRPELQTLGEVLRMVAHRPSAGAVPDAAVDSPSLVAARAVSYETIPDLQTVVADRFTTVGDLIEQARNAFARTEGDLMAVIESAGTLAPGS